MGSGDFMAKDGRVFLMAVIFDMTPALMGLQSVVSNHLSSDSGTDCYSARCLFASSPICIDMRISLDKDFRAPY